MNDDILTHKDDPVIGILKDRAVADTGFSGNQRISLPFVEKLSACGTMSYDQRRRILLCHFHNAGDCITESILEFLFPFAAVLFKLITIRERRIQRLIMTFQFAGQSSFTALRCVKRAVFFSLFRKALIVVPLTLLLPSLGFGVDGVFLAEPISNLIGGTACFTTMILTVYRKLPDRKTDQEIIV